MRRTWRVVLIALFLIVGGAPAYGAPPHQVGTLDDLWIDMAMGAPLVEWFNQFGRPDDMARIDLWEARRLDQINAGRRLVIFKSVPDAERMLPELAGKVDVVGYNLEHGPANLRAEMQDPVGSVRRMKELAGSYGLPLAMGPDHRFAVDYGPAMAPYVDIFVLQVQRVQTRPDQVLDFVAPLSRQLREANPDIQISVQVRTEGDVRDITALLEQLKPFIDGVSILTSPTTIETAHALVAALRPQPRPEPTPSFQQVEASPLVADEGPNTYAPARPAPEEAPQSPWRSWWPRRLTPIVGGLLGGIVGGAVAFAVWARHGF